MGLSRRDELPVIPARPGAALVQPVLLQPLVPGAEVRQPRAQVRHARVLQVVGHLRPEPAPAPARAGHGLLGCPDGGLGGGAAGEVGAVPRAVERGVAVLARKHHHWLNRKYDVIFR